MDEKITFAAFATVLLVFIAHPVAKAADAPASTAFSSVGRVEFSQGGTLTVGNDILALSAPDFGRQIENTDVPLSFELYAMGQRAAEEVHIDPAYEKWLRPIWRHVAGNWDRIDANRAASIAKWPALREKAAPVPHRYELRPSLRSP